MYPEQKVCYHTVIVSKNVENVIFLLILLMIFVHQQHRLKKKKAEVLSMVEMAFFLRTKRAFLLVDNSNVPSERQPSVF